MKKIFLDLDGVLVDFCQGLIDLYNLPFTVDDISYWSFPLDFWMEWTGKKEEGFWKGMTQDFWANLPKTKECNTILSLVKKHNTVLLTSSPHGDDGASDAGSGAAAGKIQWIKKNLPDFYNEGRFLIGPAKEYCASPGAVLIDDSDRNCDKWEKAGGYPILAPRPWNKMRGNDIADTIKSQLILEED